MSRKASQRGDEPVVDDERGLILTEGNLMVLGNNNGTSGAIKRSKLGRHPAAVSGKTAAKWSDDSVTCMFRLRFVKLAHKFENVKNNQIAPHAYELLAAELSVEEDQVLSAEQVQNKLHELKKKWFNPKVKATGNGSAVRTKPQYFDIMFEYWGTKLGYSHSSLLSSDPDVDVDGEVSTLSLDVGSDSDSVMGADSDIVPPETRNAKPSTVVPTNIEKKLFSAKKSSKSHTNQPSHATALLQGLQAVGNGLESIGSSFGKQPADGDMSNKILLAIEKQTEAMAKQSDQITQLLQYILRRESNVAEAQQ
ncbi:hypothetical protein AaE_015446 [Aphanomyces astaci]|uniref:Myb/SANT-like DNA-binding domain-containing protein n=1 Tax=Aphanomyces astaci TaxID=112090 RepID=A0A6A4Z7F0_APHAT|nr:hypothetical protein AaE_015446 [Aphanomyces astaci]